MIEAKISPTHYDNRFYWLDWARFLAASWVLVVHARTSNWVAYADLQPASQGPLAAAFFAITRLGHEAVILFFVLSGFLVGGRLLERCLAGSFNPMSYTIDRISRIYVPLIPIILFSVALALISDQHQAPAVIAGNLLGLQGVLVDVLVGNGPLWSLAYEIWFYVLAGALAVVVFGKQHRGVAFVLLLISLLVFTKLDLTLLVVWWLGACGYFLKDNAKSFLWPASAMAAVGAIGMQLTSNSDSVNMHIHLTGYFSNNFFVLILGAGLTLAVASICRWKPKSKGTQQLECVGPKLAAPSYTIYLIHYPILALSNHFAPFKFAALDLFSFGVFFGRVVACVLVAMVFYSLFESRTPIVRRWLNGRGRPHPPVAEKVVTTFGKQES